MHYIIDTYNLVHAAAGSGGAAGDLSVRKLCQFIAAATTRMKVTLVMDGRAKPDEPSANEFPDIGLVYSGTGVKADTVIGQMVELAKSKKKITVVSNDREVVLQARRNYANAMSCEAFLRGLTQYNPRTSGEGLPVKKVSGTATTGESEHWLEEFGLKRMPEEKPRAKAEDARVEGLDIEDLLGPRDPLS